MSVSSRSRCAALVVLLALLLPTRSAAQITVGADDYRAQLGETYTYHLVAPVDSLAFRAFAEATGPDQTFDLTTLDLQASAPLLVEYVTLPADVPGSDQQELVGSDHALRIAPVLPEDAGELPADSSLWFYRSITDGGVAMHGFFADVGLSVLDTLSLPDSISLVDSLGVPDSLLDDLPIDLDSLIFADTLMGYASPPLRTMVLPLTESAAWTSNSLAAVEFGELQLVMTASVDAAADGYGTLVTPDGQAACLRLRSTYVLQIPATDIGLTFQLIQYVTEGPLGAMILLDEGGAPLLLAYRGGSDATDVTAPPTTMQLALETATPHPFREAATLRYTLPAPSHVRLRLFDLLGREVMTVVDTARPAGPHEVRLDASRLPAGLYVARLEAGEQVRTQTLIRLR